MWRLLRGEGWAVNGIGGRTGCAKGGCRQIEGRCRVWRCLWSFHHDRARRHCSPAHPSTSKRFADKRVVCGVRRPGCHGCWSCRGGTSGTSVQPPPGLTCAPLEVQVVMQIVDSKRLLHVSLVHKLLRPGVRGL